VINLSAAVEESVAAGLHGGNAHDGAAANRPYPRQQQDQPGSQHKPAQLPQANHSASPRSTFSTTAVPVLDTNPVCRYDPSIVSPPRRPLNQGSGMTSSADRNPPNAGAPRGPINRSSRSWNSPPGGGGAWGGGNNERFVENGAMMIQDRFMPAHGNMSAHSDGMFLHISSYVSQWQGWGAHSCYFTLSGNFFSQVQILGLTICYNAVCVIDVKIWFFAFFHSC